MAFRGNLQLHNIIRAQVALHKITSFRARLLNCYITRYRTIFSVLVFTLTQTVAVFVFNSVCAIWKSCVFYKLLWPSASTRMFVVRQSYAYYCIQFAKPRTTALHTKLSTSLFRCIDRDLCVVNETCWLKMMYGFHYTLAPYLFLTSLNS